MLSHPLLSLTFSVYLLRPTTGASFSGAWADEGLTHAQDTEFNYPGGFGGQVECFVFPEHDVPTTATPESFLAFKQSNVICSYGPEGGPWGFIDGSLTDAGTKDGVAGERLVGNWYECHSGVNGNGQPAFIGGLELALQDEDTWSGPAWPSCDGTTLGAPCERDSAPHATWTAKRASSESSAHLGAAVRNCDAVQYCGGGAGKALCFEYGGSWQAATAAGDLLQMSCCRDLTDTAGLYLLTCSYTTRSGSGYLEAEVTGQGAVASGKLWELDTADESLWSDAKCSGGAHNLTFAGGDTWVGEVLAGEERSAVRDMWFAVRTAGGARPTCAAAAKCGPEPSCSAGYRIKEKCEGGGSEGIGTVLIAAVAGGLLALLLLGCCGYRYMTNRVRREQRGPLGGKPMTVDVANL